MTGDLPWVRWRDEARRPVEYTVRPSLTLPVALVASVDRIAQTNGMTRSELVEHVLANYLCSWRRP